VKIICRGILILLYLEKERGKKREGLCSRIAGDRNSARRAVEGKNLEE
jgi:hypothetical protein